MRSSFVFVLLGALSVMLVGLYSHYGVQQGQRILEQNVATASTSVHYHVLAPLGYPLMVIGGVVAGFLIVIFVMRVLIKLAHVIE